MSNDVAYCPRCCKRRVIAGRGDSIECTECGLIGVPNIKWQKFEKPENDGGE